MEAPLQQRIVGAIVLVTLGVIFIPALLDGSGYKSRQARSIEIKDKPTFPPLTQKKLEPVPTPVEKIKVAQAKAVKADKAAPQKKPIKSFALQVGTFATAENAEKMRNKLRKAGYTTFVYKVQSKGKASFKVRIGPELEHSVLEKTQKELSIKQDQIEDEIKKLGVSSV